jgi:two-component system, OmpR family, phosphate regulon sensor histidine kinase PhoR
MRSSISRELATIISSIFTILYTGSIILIGLVYPKFWWIYALVAGVLFFFIGYFILYQTLNNFILDKIQPIYKTIHDFAVSRREIRETLNQKDVIKQIRKEVEDWADLKTKEIKKLKQLEKYRKDFIGNVMHELRTPIFNIQGYVLTLLDGGINDPSINTIYLQRTEKSINRLISIVDDLEAISSLESGTLKLKMEKFDIIKLTDEVFEIHELKARQKGIKLNISSSSGKSVKVMADRKRIHDVLNNLIINSINYGVKSGKTTVSFMDMGENILVEVADNGIGIEETDIPRIFERFFRSDKSRSRDLGGTGLGLSIVKHIVEAHNQTINVKSKVDKGSSFVFTLKKG